MVDDKTRKSAAIVGAIYTDLHGLATKCALVESGRFAKCIKKTGVCDIYKQIDSSFDIF